MRLLKTFVMNLSLIAAHGGPLAQAATSDVASPYYIGNGDVADLAIEVDGGKTATLYLSKKPTNEPFVGAELSLQPAKDGEAAITFRATKEPGVYQAELKALDQLPGTIILQSATETDAIETTIPKYRGAQVSGGKTSDSGSCAGSSATTTMSKSIGIGSFAGLIIGAVVFFGLQLFQQRRGRGTMLGLFLAFTTGSSVMRPTNALAHEGHDHSGPSLDEGSDAGLDVVMPKKSQLLIELRTALAKKEAVSGVIKSFGHIIPKAQLDAIMTAPQPGFIQGIQSLSLGRKVSKGQRLGVLQAVGQIPIESPIDGEISEIHAVSGSRLEGGAKIVRITNTATLWVDAELFAEQLSRLTEATSAYITIDEVAAPIMAKILDAVSPISEETRTAKVFLELINPPKGLRIGTLATVTFALKAEAEAIPVPASAVLNRAGDRIIFVQTGPETFTPRQVLVEDSPIPGTVLVVQGIKEGERVVISGNYQLLMKAK